MEETSCYGGKASIDSIADSWRASQSEKPSKTKNIGVLDDFQQWVKEMPFSERVSWAVGGMVLTAGLLFLRSVPLYSGNYGTIFPQLSCYSLDADAFRLTDFFLKHKLLLFSSC